MLSDILGVLVAFSSIMLLLSLLVTALAQAVQHVFRLRGRNLQSGIASLFRQVGEMKRDQSLDIAARLVSHPNVLPLEPLLSPRKIPGRLFGSSVTWIEPERFRETLDSVLNDLGIPADSLDSGKLVNAYIDADSLLRKRFSVAMRYVSLALGVLVAGLFQVNTPEVLRELTNDAAYRARVVSIAEGALNSAQIQESRRDEFAPVNRSALEQLLLTYPELSEDLVLVDADLSWWGDVSEQIADRVEYRSDVEVIVAEFEMLAQNEIEARLNAELLVANETSAQLAYIDISPWRFGDDYFYVSCGNADACLDSSKLIGVFVTALLLSLGAPFWFNALKNLMSLRDLLAPSNANKGDNNG